LKHLISIIIKKKYTIIIKIKIKRTKFDPRHHNSVISEKQLMTKKYKKEHKSAIKEIRQDAQFIARVQLKEQMEKLIKFN
jgi:hypothetical protein